MATNILCPICDEELGNSVDDLPEKCPICDTRKYEIIQEIREEASGSSDTIESDPVEKKEMPGEVIVDEEETIIEQEAEVIVETPETPDVSAKDSQPIQDQIIISSVDSDIAVTGEQHATSENTDSADDYKITEGATPDDFKVANDESADGFEIVHNISYGDDDTSEEAAQGENDVIFEEATSNSKVEKDSSPARVAASAKVYPREYKKSGASSLETFPIGCKYCPSCGEGYAKDFPQDNCHYCAQKAKLKMRDSGFPPGHYLLLYNVQRKAIAYFRLDHAGSIIIGRSSERNSPNDIDLTMAWRQHYKKYAQDSTDFKEKMSLVKGISRKHALVRYIAKEEQYVLFHLSDKNYTVMELANGKKRERPPHNRTRLNLEPNAIISMGNHKNFIVLRYKIITLS